MLQMLLLSMLGLENWTTTLPQSVVSFSPKSAVEAPEDANHYMFQEQTGPRMIYCSINHWTATK